MPTKKKNNKKTKKATVKKQPKKRVAKVTKKRYPKPRKIPVDLTPQIIYRERVVPESKPTTAENELILKRAQEESKRAEDNKKQFDDSVNNQMVTLKGIADTNTELSNRFSNMVTLRNNDISDHEYNTKNIVYQTLQDAYNDIHKPAPSTRNFGFSFPSRNTSTDLAPIKAPPTVLQKEPDDYEVEVIDDSGSDGDYIPSAKQIEAEAKDAKIREEKRAAIANEEKLYTHDSYESIADANRKQIVKEYHDANGYYPKEKWGIPYIKKQTSTALKAQAQKKIKQYTNSKKN